MTLAQWTQVDEYFDELFVPRDPVLEAALSASHEAGLPAINVAPSQGKLLMLLARMQGARRILEIGTLGGYSAIWMGRALPEGGRLISLEIDEHHAEVARGNIARAGLDGKVEVRVGPALDGLAKLREEHVEPFDLAFIDADKRNAPAYFNAAVELSHAGSVIVVDNIVRQGKLIDPDADGDPDTAGMRTLLEQMGSDRRVIPAGLQTVGVKGWDGIAFAMVVGS